MAEGIVKRVAANLRSLREAAGLSLSELARRSKLSKGLLSRIEAGQANPTVETLWSLAQALGVPFSDLTEEPRPPVVHVTRADDEEWISGEPISSRLVHRLITPGVLEVHQIRVRPGPARHSAAHAVGLTEHVVLQSGRMRVGPADAPVVLAAGDSASYPADRPHVYEALAASTTGLILMNYPATGSRSLALG